MELPWTSTSTKEDAEASYRRAEVQRRGILIPPNFGIDVGENAPPPLSSTLINLLRFESYHHPSLIRHLSLHDLSNRILSDYMQSGLSLSSSSAATVTATPTTFKSGVFPVVTQNTTTLATLFSLHRSIFGSPEHPWSTRLCLGQSPVPAIMKDENSESDPTLSPFCTFASVWRVFPCLNVMAHANSVSGDGWIGTHWHFSGTSTPPTSFALNKESGMKDEPCGKRKVLFQNLRFGSWFGWRWQRALQRAQPQSEHPFRDRLINQNAVAYAAVDFLGSTAAVEVKCPIDSLKLETRTFLSINLTDDNCDSISTPSPQHATSQSSSSLAPPPLIATLERSSTLGDDNEQYVKSSISISQIFHVDRNQFNPLEDRAPYIRNLLAWTVRMEQFKHPQQVFQTQSSTVEPMMKTGKKATTEPTTPAATTTTTQLSVGGVWQINRVVAIKAVARPTSTHRNSSLSLALLLRRWKEPRVTCSLLFGNGSNDNGFDTAAISSSSSSSSRGWWNYYSPRFLGLGVQVEIGGCDEEEDPLSSSSSKRRHSSLEDKKYYLIAPNATRTPETQAIL